MTDELDRLPSADGRAVFAELRRAMTGRWWLVLWIVVIMASAAAAGLVLPVALGSIVDNVGSDRSSSYLVGLAAAIVGASVARAALNGVGILVSGRLFDRLVAWLRERLVDRALVLGQDVLERAGSGDLVSRVGDDVNVVSDSMSGVVPAVSMAIFTIVVTVVGLAALDPRFLLAFCFVAPVQVIAVRYYLRSAPPIWAEARVKAAARSNQVLGSFRGADTVIAYRMSEDHLDKIARSSWAVVRYGLLTRIVLNRFSTRLSVAEFAGLAGLLGIGYILVESGYATVGAATTAMLFLLRIFEPVNNVLYVLDDLQTAVASLSRVVGVIQLGDHLSDDSTEDSSIDAIGTTRRVGDGAIRIRNVSFAYGPGHAVLHDIDLDMRAGEHVALVGSSGAGKSTLAALIAGIYRPQSGTIEIDGVPLHDLGQRQIAAAVGLITQEVHIFAGTLRDDLTLARPNASDAELAGALEAVAAADWVAALTDGLATIVGWHAHQLTASQAHQMALARLLLKAPPIAILDEATAEAGSSGARLLERAADAAIEGRTALVVAHRLSQATRADRIIVMERGRIVETGSHQALVAIGGHYARLWNAWSTHR